MKSILRRATPATDAASATSTDRRRPARPKPVIRHADLVLDPDRHEVRRGRPAIDLTRVEFRLLETILDADGRVLTRDQLLDAVYGDDGAEVLDRTIDVHVGRLRDKLGDDAEQPRYVATVRGVGYRAARVDPTRRDAAAGSRSGSRWRPSPPRPSGSAILAVGVAVVGADVFTELMMEAGDSAEHARAMYDESVTTVVVAAFDRRGAREHRASPSCWPGCSRGRWPRSVPPPGAIAEGDYAARVPREGPEELVQPRRLVQPDGRQPRAPGAMRRDFIANAAHELRTPLTNLQGYLEALRDGVINADRATYESLHEEADRLVRLSRSLDALAEGDAATAPPDAGRARPRGGRPRSARRAGPARRSSGPGSRSRSRSRTACRRGPTPTSSPRSWPTCSRTRPATRRAGGTVTVRAERRPARPARLGRQHRRRDPARRPRARVRALLPRREVARPGARRRGDRARDRQAARRVGGRPGRGGVGRRPDARSGSASRADAPVGPASIRARAKATSSSCATSDANADDGM